MRTVAIVQARMGSSRLPGKSLTAVAGRPLLRHVLDRVQAMELIDEVVLATSANARDAPLCDLARQAGCLSSVGSEWDVLDRVREAAEAARAEIIVRVTGDCPLWAPEVGALVLLNFMAVRPDYAWNDTTRSGYPDGTDVEVFTMAALRQAAIRATRLGDREHVTPWMRRHLECAIVVNADGDCSTLKWSVDTMDDLTYVRRIAGRLSPQAYGLADTLAACHAEEVASGP